MDPGGEIAVERQQLQHGILLGAKDEAVAETEAQMQQSGEPRRLAEIARRPAAGSGARRTEEDLLRRPAAEVVDHPTLDVVPGVYVGVAFERGEAAARA